MAEMPNALTPENIAAVAQHADKILAAIFGQNPAQPPAPVQAPVQVEAPVKAPVQVESTVKAPAHARRPHYEPQEPECCCPRKVKFFIFGNTWINNYNAACPLVPQ